MADLLTAIVLQCNGFATSMLSMRIRLLAPLSLMQVEIEMEDGSKPPHKFTDLCWEVMWLTSPAADSPPIPLFDAIIPIVSGQQNGSATITYWTDNKEAAELICKICRSVAG